MSVTSMSGLSGLSRPEDWAGPSAQVAQAAQIARAAQTAQAEKQAPAPTQELEEANTAFSSGQAPQAPVDSGVADGSYSLVAWPPSQLDCWLRRLQRSLGVSGFGVPHINVRAPFRTPLSRRELIAKFRDVLDGASSFEVTVKGFRRHRGVIFLECEASARMLYLHLVALGVGPSSRSPFDGEAYSPHLTLALGVLPWAEDELWERVQGLDLPLTRFRVSALSLTVEEKGEFLELHTFPLTDPPVSPPPSSPAPPAEDPAPSV